MCCVRPLAEVRILVQYGQGNSDCMVEMKQCNVAEDVDGSVVHVDCWLFEVQKCGVFIK